MVASWDRIVLSQFYRRTSSFLTSCLLSFISCWSVATSRVLCWVECVGTLSFFSAKSLNQLLGVAGDVKVLGLVMLLWHFLIIIIFCILWRYTGTVTRFNRLSVGTCRQCPAILLWETGSRDFGSWSTAFRLHPRRIYRIQGGSANNLIVSPQK